jgi:hypothetical protein
MLVLAFGKQIVSNGQCGLEARFVGVTKGEMAMAIKIPEFYQGRIQKTQMDLRIASFQLQTKNRAGFTQEQYAILLSINGAVEETLILLEDAFKEIYVAQDQRWPASSPP